MISRHAESAFTSGTTEGKQKRLMVFLEHIHCAYIFIYIYKYIFIDIL